MFNKIASNTIAQVVSKIITAVISIFLLSVLTNYLSVELFWVYSKVYNYLWIFAFLADLGLYTIMIREISKWEEKSEKIVWNVLSLRVFLGVLISFLALFIAYFIPWYNSNIELMAIWIVWIFTLVSLVNSTFLAYMQSQLKMEFSLLSVVFWKLVNLSWVLLIVYVFITQKSLQLNSWNSVYSLDSSLLFILGAWLLWISVNTLMNYFYTKKSCDIKMRFDMDYIKYIFKISLPYWIALFLSVVYFKIDIIILSLLEGDTADISIALYSLPMKIVEVLMVISGFYLNSILPKLTQLFEKQRHSWELQNLLTLSFKILFAFGLSVFTFWVIFRDYLITIIANSDYISPTNHIYSSSDVFIIVLAILLFNAISLLFIYIFIWSKKQSILLKINIFIALFNIIGNIILIPKYSFMWAWVVTLVSQILLFAISYYFSWKIIKFSFPIAFIFKTLAISGVFFVTLYYLTNNYSIWVFQDLFLYWVTWFSWYIYIIYRLIK